MAKGKVHYVHNRVLFSPLTNSFFFVPKAKVLGTTSLTSGNEVLQVVGNKIDVSDSLQHYLLKKYRKKI